MVQDIHNRVNQEDCGGQSISERIFSEATLLTGSEPIHSYGSDFYQGILPLFLQEFREREQRLTPLSTTSTDPESLAVVTKHIAQIINNSNDTYTRKDIMIDLNSISITSVSDMHLCIDIRV